MNISAITQQPAKELKIQKTESAPAKEEAAPSDSTQKYMPEPGKGEKLDKEV